MKYMKISPEYDCCPIWLSEDGELYYNASVESLPFNNSLKQKINAYARKFNETLNQEYPPKSSFKSAYEELSFEYLGLEIWKEIEDNYKGVYLFTSYVSYSLGIIYSNNERFLIDLKDKFRNIINQNN
ncbi:hypothetical protein GCM10028805_00790 [Spirosoma harenae]